MTDKKTDGILAAEAELIAAGSALQEQGLALLLAEMQALKGMMTAATPKQEPPSEAETEAGFDNMPV